MAKRKRTTKSRSAAGAVSVEKPDLYNPDYGGRRWWLLGIKVDGDRNQLPLHNGAFGGIPWQQGTQNQVMDDGWFGLDRHRLRLTRQLLSAPQVKRAVQEISQKVVRWYPRRFETADGPVERWAADVLSLEHRIKTLNRKTKEFVPAGYRFHAGANDQPLSRYLVFIPRSMLKDVSDAGKMYEPDLEKLPSMLDLDPSLIPHRMKERNQDMSDGDEPW